MSDVTPLQHDEIIEKVACEIERMRMRGQKYYWWNAFWTYFDTPLHDREEIAAVVRKLKIASH